MSEEEYEEDDTLAHIGVLHKSGRYPWGSGEDPYQRSLGFQKHIKQLKAEGMSDAEIAKSLGIKTPELRANKTIARSNVYAANVARAMQLRDKGLGPSAIGRIMKVPEPTIRNYLNPANAVKADALQSTANMLKKYVDEYKYLDVGVGTEHHLGGISDTKLRNAVALLREEGYERFYTKIPQLGTTHETTLQVLAPPGTTWEEFKANKDNIRTVAEYTTDGGRTYKPLVPPKPVDPKRVTVRYAEEGGSQKDGVIELRRGVDDISLGSAKYAQVRVQVGKDRYLKGMAMYADDLPDGVDIRFNTNKSDTGNHLDAMKKIDPKYPENNPFGSMIYQKTYTDKSGKEQLSPLNLVNEEGKWGDWSSNLSSQFLSKQPEYLAKQQLQVRYDMKKKEFDELTALTNPVVKQKLLEAFSDSADSSAVHLKAAGLPRTATKVILPIPSLKDNEIYAPSYNQGEKVVLVRHPHGGIFEIPELTVNNRNQEAKRLIPDAKDAVGINHRVAERLSGADFDGDTVLVIPNDRGMVKTAPALLALKNFDAKTQYAYYDGMHVMSPADKQHKMGDISNLITDMTIGGATNAELARAVKHSMVVIDAEKHKLNYKQSAIDNGISQLKVKYQGSATSGAKTLISRAQAQIAVPNRKERPAELGGKIDKETGEKKYIPTGESYIKRTESKKNGVQEKVIVKTFKSKQAAETNDARTLIGDKQTPIEHVYADYSNKMKALANAARKEMVNTKLREQNKSAKEIYAPQVARLRANLNTALKNAPLERQAQIVGNALANARIEATPGIDKADIKKIKSQALNEARDRVGAKKALIHIEDDEWDAIQAGAVSSSVLKQILNHTDLDRVKELATPRDVTTVTSAKLARAKSMAASGYTQSEIANALGISVSTLNNALNPKKG